MSDHAAGGQIAMPKHGEICWSELATTDLEVCKSFYSELFGWKYKESDATEMRYTEMSNGDGETFGGMYNQTGEMAGVPPHWMSYVAVDDVDESLAKAEELGGQVVVPAMDIPETGRFGVITDPSGAAIAMITLSQT